MARAICYCEPKIAYAGETNTWHLIYAPARRLPKGTKLRLDLFSDGREIDLELPQTDLKKNANVIFLKFSNGKKVAAHAVSQETSLCPLYDFTLNQDVEQDDKVTIVIGSTSDDPTTFASQGTRTQQYTQRRRTFHLFVDTTGKGKFGEPEAFTMDVKGTKLKNIRILNPSLVLKNKRFDVVVRFEDEYGNLTSDAPPDTLIELEHESLRENLSWKLFVPETGFLTIPNLYFNESGVYTIQLRNSKTKEMYRSFPIKCFPENEIQLFWGLLHGESDRIDSTENIESCLRHFRDERALNFFCSSPFSDVEETPNDMWKLISQNIAEFEEVDRFSTMLGFQWVGTVKSEGVRQFIYAKDNKLLIRKSELKNSSLKDIYSDFNPKEIISMPSFTMGKGYEFDFQQFYPEFERIVEIYNAWGCSERSRNEGNTKSIKGPSPKGVNESAEGAVQKALMRNCRFGFVAGGLDDRGIYQTFYDGGQEQYTPGLTAIIAKEHSRSALFEALYHRSCYATTGERIVVGISLAGATMGQEIQISKKLGLAVNRHVNCYIAGTSAIEKVEVIRNGKEVHTIHPESYHVEFGYDDMIPIEEVAIKPKEGSPFVYYYLRVIQKDGHMAWSSPIWVDDDRVQTAAKPVKVASKKS